MNLDVDIIVAIQSFLRHPTTIFLAVFCARYAIFCFFPLAVYAYFGPHKNTDRHVVKDAVWTLFLAILFAAIIGDLIGRARPFIEHHEVLRLVPAPLSAASFPSRHAASAFALAGMLWFASRPIAWSGVALAFLVAFGRVAVGVHYPSDVLAGALLGLACAWLVRKLHAMMRKRDLSHA